ncbi:hypothetical protein [Nocardioides alcanivorans]|uniref:hypothetical protein n=1 Tax=Nocardioides alcanivorans TaxID=2897352 RepID=UPI001F38E208|nr:hypothetical protein [Nocardioides alcanivorans]
MTRDARLLGGAVRALAVLAVVSTLGAGIGAAVVQAGEEPGASAERSPTEPVATPVEDPFVEEPRGGFRYERWVFQRNGDGVTYRIPGGWHVRPVHDQVTATDATGEVRGRGNLAANYYGNRCTDEVARAGAWTLLAEPVPGDDAAAAAEEAVVAWANGYNHNQSGTLTADISDPVTETVELADGDEAVRSWVSIDTSVFGSACVPDRTEIAVTTVPHGDELVSLVQGRHVLETGGLGDADWSAISLSLAVK